MSFNEIEAAVLRKAAEPCPDTGCPCKRWKRDVADRARRNAPDVPDVVLAAVLLHVSGYTTTAALAHDLHGAQVGGILTGAAADLAALHLQGGAP